MLEGTLAAYGWQVRYALSRPLALLFALAAARNSRAGHQFRGPTYQEQEWMAAQDESGD